MCFDFVKKIKNYNTNFVFQIWKIASQIVFLLTPWLTNHGYWYKNRIFVKGTNCRALLPPEDHGSVSYNNCDALGDYDKSEIFSKCVTKNLTLRHHSHHFGGVSDVSMWKMKCYRAVSGFVRSTKKWSCWFAFFTNTDISYWQIFPPLVRSKSKMMLRMGAVCQTSFWRCLAM